MTDLTKPNEIARAEVLPPVDLTALAKQINDNHSAIVSAAKSAVTKAIAAGEALISAKAAVEAEHGYGHWGRWLKVNIAASPRTVQAYMQLAEGKLQLDAMLRDSSATVAQLTFNGALEMIRAPSSSPPRTPTDRATKLTDDLLQMLVSMPLALAAQRAHRLVERLQEERLI